MYSLLGFPTRKGSSGRVTTCFALPGLNHSTGGRKGDFLGRVANTNCVLLSPMGTIQKNFRFVFISKREFFDPELADPKLAWYGHSLTKFGRPTRRVQAFCRNKKSASGRPCFGWELFWVPPEPPSQSFLVLLNNAWFALTNQMSRDWSTSVTSSR